MNRIRLFSLPVLALPTLALLAGALSLGLPAAPAHAQDAEAIGQHGEWEAYTRGEGESKFCYMVSKPREASLRSRRGDIFFLVWHRPAQKEFDVVQIDIGYPFKDESEVEVEIGGKAWTLFTRDQNAWTYRPEDDKALVEAIRGGSRMTVKGTSSRGSETTDVYSLSGSAAAHAAIDKACPRG